MEIRIRVENGIYEDDGHYEYVDVPLQEIANILAKRYGINGEAMYMIICDYDLDLDEDLENNQEILDLAYKKIKRRLSK